jgi:hypothetical protein
MPIAGQPKSTQRAIDARDDGYDQCRRWIPGRSAGMAVLCDGPRAPARATPRPPGRVAVRVYHRSESFGGPTADDPTALTPGGVPRITRPPVFGWRLATAIEVLDRELPRRVTA